MGPPFGGRGGRRGSVMAPFERATVVSFRPKLSIVVTMLKSTGVGHFGPKFPVAPLGVDPWCLGLHSADSERPTLTNLKIIFEEFQPMSSQSTNVTDGQNDGRTDRRHRKTALCTAVHRAVKIVMQFELFCRMHKRHKNVPDKQADHGRRLPAIRCRSSVRVSLGVYR